MKRMQIALSQNAYDKKIAMTIFGVFLCLFIIQIYRFLFPASVDFQEEKVNKPRLEQKIISAKSALFTIPLFGTYVPVNLADNEIKQSKLDFEVVGIMYSPNEKNSQVLIRVAAGEEKAYFVGDSLPGSVIIKRIRQHSILVLHNGTLESLSLPKNDLRFEKPAKPLIEE